MPRRMYSFSRKWVPDLWPVEGIQGSARSGRKDYRFRKILNAKLQDSSRGLLAGENSVEGKNRLKSLFNIQQGYARHDEIHRKASLTNSVPFRIISSELRWNNPA